MRSWRRSVCCRSPALAQLAPAFFGGLFWREGTARGAMTGMLVGFAVWAYTLFLPSFLEGNPTGLLLLQHGPFGIEALRPRALFGADLPPLMHGVLWSLSLNILTYIVMSIAQRPSSIERLQADLFVPNTLTPIAPTFRRWRTTVTVQDIQSTVAQYLGPERAAPGLRGLCRRPSRQSRSGRARRFRIAATRRTPDRLLDRGRLLAPRDVAVAAQANRLRQGRAETARRFPRRAAFQPRDFADRAEPCAPGHRGVRCGFAVDLLERPVRRNSRAAAASRAARHPPAGNPRIHGRRQPGRLRRPRWVAAAAAGCLHHRGRALSGAPARPPHGDRGPLQPDAGRRLRRHLLRRHAELRGRRSAGTRQCDAGKARPRPHRGTHAPEFRTGAGQEHRRGRQHLEDPLPGGRQPRHPAAAQRGAALCDEPRRAAEAAARIRAWSRTSTTRWRRSRKSSARCWTFRGSMQAR